MDYSRAIIKNNMIYSYANEPGEKITFQKSANNLSIFEEFTFNRPDLVEELEIDGIENFGEVFANLPNLKKLTVRNTEIPNSAFAGEVNLSAVELDNVTIWDKSFWDCPKLKTVSLEKVKSLFSNSFDFHNMSGFVQPIEGLTVYDNWVVGYKEPSLMNQTEDFILIGENIKGIAGYVFKCDKCSMDVPKIKSIKAVVIQSKDISFGPLSFYGSDLKKITFKYENAVRFIGMGAFSGTNLTDFDCKSFDVEVGSCIFSDCRHLESVVWPARTLPDSTFKDCVELHTLNISNIQKIGNCALAGCRKITRLDIPDTVTNIGRYALAGMGNISLNIPQNAILEFRVLWRTTLLTEEKDGNSILDGWLVKSRFSKASQGKHIERVVLEDYITGVLPGAFDGITIEDLYLSPNTKIICPEALEGTNLHRLHGSTGLKAIPTELFRECPNLEDIDIYNTTVFITGSSNNIYDTTVVIEGIDENP